MQATAHTTEPWQFSVETPLVPLTEYQYERNGRLLSCSRLVDGIDPLVFCARHTGRHAVTGVMGAVTSRLRAWVSPPI